MPQYNMEKLDRKHKVRFTKVSDNGTSYVEAPLPEQYGMTVGSEFTAPFDASALAGVLQKAKLPFAGGISRKVGVVTTKLYSNPEPTEISFDLEFHAEVSARHEVVEPIVSLMCLSLGTYYDADSVASEVKKIRNGVADILDIFGVGDVIRPDADTGVAEISQDDAEGTVSGMFGGYSPAEAGSDALSFIGLIRSPDVVRVDFGTLYSLDNVWVSSVGAQFSNILDAEGFPLSGTASVTIVLQRDPVTQDIHRYFGVA